MGFIRRAGTAIALLGATIAVPASAAFSTGGLYGPNGVNVIPIRPYGELPPSATEPPSGQAVKLAPTTVPVPTDSGPTVRAGIASVDGTWKVGSSAGQYATAVEDDTSIAVGDHTKDPNVLSIHRAPSYGIETRTNFRALVIEGVDGKRHAIVANNFYIAQDLVNRRVAAILRDRDTAINAHLQGGNPTGIDDSNLTVYISHDHSSPFYSSTGWGVWTFQDVFDLRFFEYVAQKMADAVVQANDALRPVRMGAAVVPYDYTQRHSFGPQIGFDGTPAGYPKRDNDLTVRVMRFDDITNRNHPRPYAVWYILGQHPEFTEGNNLLTDEWPGKVSHFLEAETGATAIFSQNNPGTTEEDGNGQTHAPAVRAEFDHKDYAQQERGARQIANAVIRGMNAVGTNKPIVAAGVKPADQKAYVATTFVPYQPLNFTVSELDRRFAPPYSHPYPSVSNCRTPAAFNGNPGIPLLGLPDCNNDAGALFGPVFGQLKGTPLDPGVTYTDLVAAGVPLPANYGAPSYTGLEETIQVHIQVLRLGEVVVTACPCEQWADQSRNIVSRADKVQGNQWLGLDWTQFCTRRDASTWTCPNPDAVANYDQVPSRPTGPNSTLLISDGQYRQMHAQVVNDAAGWDDPANLATAESEPVDPTLIKGNYTHTELPASLGYSMVIPTSHVNDYWGYIATYREYQRGDHYRKALTGLGAHSSDWLATRMVAMAAVLKEGTDPGACPGAVSGGDYWTQKVTYNALDCTYMVDDANQKARAELIGRDAAAYLPLYEATIPADSGLPAGVAQPANITRFDRADFSWIGGDNYVDSPNVRVEREVSPGKWVTQGDSFGDVQTFVKYPADVKAETATYRTGSFQWNWTAHFEAFNSDIDTASSGRQTPAGTYRFVVDGSHRAGTPAQTLPYHVVSGTFQVKPWNGITVPDIRTEADGTVSFSVGPVATRQYNTDEYQHRPQDPSHVVTYQVGPIAYPDTYLTSPYPDHPETGDHLFPRVQRNVIVDSNGKLTGQRWCFSCSFRPWADHSDVATARVAIVKGGQCQTVPATRGSDGRFHITRALNRGEVAVVPTGFIKDTYGELNGTSSTAVSRDGATTKPVLPARCPAAGPAPTPSPSASASPSGPPPPQLPQPGGGWAAGLSLVLPQLERAYRLP
ncbi:MAG: hypothetical protein QOK05_1086 [Chloroflexota bacterium]|jgi:hypothetical protein|nr:hypothetical protein [Chloroflexota bacterium]